jgi:DNA-directed RNA polymerase subunit RPC12/RpoP
MCNGSTRDLKQGGHPYSNQQVYNDNAEEDDEDEEEEEEDFPGLQIVSVESMSGNNNEQQEHVLEDEEDEDDQDDDDDDDEEEEIIVDPSTLTDLDYDDIIDDAIYDEDLEEIQIEPDIIDYDEEQNSVSPTQQQQATHFTAAAAASDSGSMIQLLREPVPLSSADFNIFTCSHCYDKFSKQSAFLAHLTSSHMSGGRFEHPTGQEDLERGYAIVRYASRVKYLCLSCGKQFIKEDHIRDHIKVHFQENAYNCLHCDKIFSSYDVYESHVDSHRIHCQHCNDIFPDRQSAHQHEEACPMNIFQTYKNSKGRKGDTTSIRCSSIGVGDIKIKLEPELIMEPTIKECKVILNRVDEEMKPFVKKEKLEIKEEEEEEEEVVMDFNLHPPAAVMNMLPPLAPTRQMLKTSFSCLRPIAPAPIATIAQPQPPTSMQLLSFNPVSSSVVPCGGSQQPQMISPAAGTPLLLPTTPMLISTAPITQLPTEPIVIKPVERRRAPPQAKFPTDDAYIPDNNSNNVVNKEEIVPPPEEEEKKVGFCQRTISDGRTRLICITCGKHYTTMYNMRQHRNIHSGRGLHTCRYCTKEFTHKHIWEVSTHNKGEKLCYAMPCHDMQ